MPNFLYTAYSVLPNPTPTLFSHVISSHSEARVTRLLTISCRAVSYFQFPVPLDVLLPLPRWPFSPQKTSLQTLLKAHLLPKDLLPSPAFCILLHSHTLTLLNYHIYVFTYLSPNLKVIFVSSSLPSSPLAPFLIATSPSMDAH